MLSQAQSLGDSGKPGPNNSFVPDWEQTFKDGVDGLITVAGDSDKTIQGKSIARS